MENEKKGGEYYVVDLLHVVKFVWSRIWMVVLCGILTAGIGFGLSAFVLPPKYESSTMLYVNNSSFSLGSSGFNISASEITAARSLVETYRVILLNRTTLEAVIELAGSELTYQELYESIRAEAVNETEIMRVTITSEDPEEASLLANCIAEVLPVRIKAVIEGATMEVVDAAVPDPQKVSPGVAKYTAVGLLLGIMFSVMALAGLALSDTTIHDEDYVISQYSYPILAKVPNLLESDKNRYNYYYRSHKSSGRTGGGKK